MRADHACLFDRAHGVDVVKTAASGFDHAGQAASCI
jgi:hypothetical protein